MMGAGYQWWGLSGFAPSALAAGAASAAPLSTPLSTASSLIMD